MDHDTNHNYGLAICPNCLCRIEKVLPVEPLYTLQETAYLIPMNYGALRTWLTRHKDAFPNRRYQQGRNKCLRRLLTASEVRYIRSHLLRFKDNTGKYRPATPYGE